MVLLGRPREEGLAGWYNPAEAKADTRLEAHMDSEAHRLGRTAVPGRTAGADHTAVPDHMAGADHTAEVEAQAPEPEIWHRMDSWEVPV